MARSEIMTKCLRLLKSGEKGSAALKHLLHFHPGLLLNKIAEASEISDALGLLHEIARQDRVDIIQFIFSSDPKGKNSLGLSAEKRQQLIDSYQGSTFSLSPQHMAAQEGKYFALRALLDHGFSVDSKVSLQYKNIGRRGFTPLHFAAVSGNMDNVITIIGKGADLKAKDAKGRYAFEIPGVGDKKNSFAEIRGLFKQAVEQGNVSVVKGQLQRNASWLTLPLDEEGNTLLHYAAKHGQIDILRYVLNDYLFARGLASETTALSDIKKILSTCVNKQGAQPHHSAAKHGQRHALDYLLAKGADVNARVTSGKEQGYNVLSYATQNSDRNMFHALLLCGIEVSSSFSNHCVFEVKASDSIQSEANSIWMRLQSQVSRVGEHAAASLANICDVLKKNISWVWARDSSGNTLLHLLAEHGRTDVVQWIFKQGITREQHQAILSIRRNKAGLLPQHIAAREGYTELLRLLHKQNISINRKTIEGKHSGYTPLHFAVAKKNFAMVTALAEMSADFALTDNQGKKVYELASWKKNNTFTQELIMACFSGNETRLMALIKTSHCLRIPLDSQGNTVLHHLAARGHLAIIQRIEEFLDGLGESSDEKKALLSITNQSGLSPLHSAILCGREAVVDDLMSEEVDINTKISAGVFKEMTALDLAESEKYFTIADKLRQRGAQCNRVKVLSRPITESKEIKEVKQSSPIKKKTRAKILKSGSQGNHALEIKSDGRVTMAFQEEQKERLKDEKKQRKAQEEKAQKKQQEAVWKKLIIECLKTPGADSAQQLQALRAQYAWPLDEGITEGGLPALHLAAKHGNVEVMQFLISEGANIDAEAPHHERENTALKAAVMASSEKSIDFLLKKGARFKLDGETVSAVDLPVRGSTDNNLLHQREQRLWKQARDGKDDKVKQALRETREWLYLESRLAAHWDISWREAISFIFSPKPHGLGLTSDEMRRVIAVSPSNAGITWLHYAAEYASVDIVKRLLDHGADINAQTPAVHADYPLYTPAHFAKFRGSNAMLTLLDERGADLSLVSLSGRRIIQICNEYAFDACLDIQHYQLYQALRRNLTEQGLSLLKEQLSRNKSRLKVPFNYGGCVLHYLAEQKDTRGLAYVLGNNSGDLNLSAEEKRGLLKFYSEIGRYPQHDAVYNKNLEALKLLSIQPGFNINARTQTESEKETCLHIAVKLKNKPIVDFLIAKGADPAIQNLNKKRADEIPAYDNLIKAKYTVLHCALVTQKDNEVVKQFLGWHLNWFTLPIGPKKETAIELAAKSQNSAAMKMIVDAFVKAGKEKQLVALLEKEDQYGLTALDYPVADKKNKPKAYHNFIKTYYAEKKDVERPEKTTAISRLAQGQRLFKLIQSEPLLFEHLLDRKDEWGEATQKTLIKTLKDNPEHLLPFFSSLPIESLSRQEAFLKKILGDFLQEPTARMLALYREKPAQSKSEKFKKMLRWSEQFARETFFNALPYATKAIILEHGLLGFEQNIPQAFKYYEQISSKNMLPFMWASHRLAHRKIYERVNAEPLAGGEDENAKRDEIKEKESKAGKPAAKKRKKKKNTLEVMLKYPESLAERLVDTLNHEKTMRSLKASVGKHPQLFMALLPRLLESDLYAHSTDLSELLDTALEALIKREKKENILELMLEKPDLLDFYLRHSFYHEKAMDSLKTSTKENPYLFIMLLCRLSTNDLLKHDADITHLLDELYDSLEKCEHPNAARVPKREALIDALPRITQLDIAEFGLFKTPPDKLKANRISKEIEKLAKTSSERLTYEGRCISLSRKGAVRGTELISYRRYCTIVEQRKHLKEAMSVLTPTYAGTFAQRGRMLKK